MDCISNSKYSFDEFYNTLRESLNKDIIEDSLIFHRHPIYNTGNEFLINMKHFLSVVYFRRYDLLVDYQEQMLEIWRSYWLQKSSGLCH